MHDQLSVDAPVAGGISARATSSSDVPVVEVLSAEKIYPNGTRALDPVSLSIREREFITLLGPSGCGKSTLLKMVAGLLQPSDGRLRWWRQGFDAVGTEGRKLVFVFQDPTLMPWARVEGNVRLPLDLAGTSRESAKPRVDAALKLVGLDGFGTHYPRELSGGMQMRVSIARARVNEPDLLLMDEPFGALDEITRNRLDADLISLWWQRHLTVVFVTHSIYEAVFLSTRVVVMAARPGRVMKEVIIDEPHPRTDAFRVTQRFAAYCKELTELLAEASAGGGPAPGKSPGASR